MPQTITGTLRGNVITLDAESPVPRTREPHEGHRVRVSLEILKPAPGSPSPTALRRENRKRLAQINDAVADGPDAEEKKLREHMMRLLRQRDFDR